MDRDDEDREARRLELDSALANIRRAIEASTSEMNRYKGFVGGISLTISMLWAGVAFFKESIVGWLSR